MIWQRMKRSKGTPHRSKVLLLIVCTCMQPVCAFMHHFKKYHFLYFSNSCIKNRTCTISLLFRWYCDNKICIVLMASTRMKVISSGCLLLFEPLAFAREGATWVRFSFGGDVWSPLRLLGSRLFLHIFAYILRI